MHVGFQSPVPDVRRIARTVTSVAFRTTDLVAVALRGTARKPVRSALAATGIALGTAAIIGVLGISASSESAVLGKIDRVSSLLEVSDKGGSPEASRLPSAAPLMARRIGSVLSASAISLVDINAYRNDLIPTEQSSALRVVAVEPNLLEPTQGTMVRGQFLTEAAGRLPDVVLGYRAAARLGLDRVGVRIWIGRRWFTVIGIMHSFEAAPELDDSVLVGVPAATDYFGYDGGFTDLYVRSRPSDVDAVASILPAAVAPGHPENVAVTKASAAIAIRNTTQNTLTGLTVGLGLVGIVVGGLGIANTMIMSVLERRVEVAIRRALGAPKRNIYAQFICESMILGGVGGAVGALCGILAVLMFALTKGLDARLPWYEPAGAALGALLVGILAGIYPALRAAAVSPSEILRAE